MTPLELGFGLQNAERAVHAAFGILWAGVLVGLLLCSLRGKGLPRETVAWAITGVVFYALFFWPGWLQSAGQ